MVKTAFPFYLSLKRPRSQRIAEECIYSLAPISKRCKLNVCKQKKKLTEFISQKRPAVGDKMRETLTYEVVIEERVIDAIVKLSRTRELPV